MRTSNKKNRQQKLLRSLFWLLAMLVLCLLLYVVLSKTGLFRPIASTNNDNSSLSKDEKTSGDIIKKQVINDSQKDATPQGSDPSPQPTPAQNGEKATVAVEITAKNQTDSALQVRTLIQAISVLGRCTLTLTSQSGEVYSDTVETQLLPSTSTCKGFDVPLKGLSAGSWELKIYYEDETAIGDVTSKVMVK